MDEDPFEEFDWEGDGEKRELTTVERVKRALYSLVALVVIGGLLYISGIYQGMFFWRTPSDTMAPLHETLIEVEEIILPIEVFVLQGSGSLSSAREEDDVEQIVRNASNIWNQARIKFSLERVEFLELEQGEIEKLIDNPSAYVHLIPGYNEDAINVFLTRALYGINGVAYLGSKNLAVADYTTSYDYRTLAHEIGHILGLPHVEGADRLMASGGRGTRLTVKEVEDARTNCIIDLCLKNTSSI